MWEDIYLSLEYSNRTYDLSENQDVPENPIYRVKAFEFHEVVLIDTVTREAVKVLANRKYSPQIIYFYDQYKTQVKTYKKTNLNAFF